MSGNYNNFKLRADNMKQDKMQQPGMYWDGKQYRKAVGTGTYMNGSYFAMGGYSDQPAQFSHENGQSVWQGQGINFRSPDPQGYIPPQQPVLPFIRPQVPMMGGAYSGYGQGTGQGYMSGAVGNGASGDVFGNAHGPQFKKGGIHIKKSHEGLFTKKANAAGMGIQEYAHHVMNNPDASSATRKQANFAIQAAKWHHQYGGPIDNADMSPEMKSGGHWIQGAVKHPGRCTPGSPNYDCPKGSPQWRLAQTFKKHHGFHQYGGPAIPQMDNGGYSNPWQTVNPNDAIMEQMYTQRDHTQDVIQQNPDMYSGQPMVTSDYMTPNGNGTNPDYQVQQPQSQQPMVMGRKQPYGNNFKNLLGAGMIAGAYFADRKSQRDNAAWTMNNGLTSMRGQNPMDNKGNYTQQGQFRPDSRVYSNPGMYYPGMQFGGQIPQYQKGGVYEMADHDINRLRAMGYQIDEL